MLRKEMSKSDIEKELQGKGDFVLIDNITRFLKETLPMDTKKFLYNKLVSIYEKRAMFLDAAEICNKMCEVALTPKERTDCTTKAIEFYIKAGTFEKADLMAKRFTGDEVSLKEAQRMNNSIKDLYKTQAQIYEKERRRNRAVKTYEKILTMNILASEKDEINQKLLGLYKELGMVSEYMLLKKKLEK